MNDCKTFIRAAPGGPATEGTVLQERAGKKLLPLTQEDVLRRGDVRHDGLATEGATPETRGPRYASDKRRAAIRGLCLVFLATLTTVCEGKQQTATEETPTIQFERTSELPYIPRVPSTFFSVLVANPAVIEFEGDMFFFFRGQDESGKDQIGLWKTPASEADGIHWKEQLPEPVIPVSADPDAPDNAYILDPATVVKGDSLLVYYTGKSENASTFSTISLSITTDGQTFKKFEANPILEDAIAPEVVFHDGLFHLFYQRLHEDRFWEVYVATSRDGIDFDVANERKVFGPSRQAGAFDAHSVATVRIFKEDDYFYMTYAACARFLDYPESIGLARSRDLIDWERYPHNPIFERGDAGTWDEGALWFATVRKMGGKYLMWYEGAGTGLGLISEAARAASKVARDEDYGGYRTTSFSQMGLAVFEGSIGDGWEKSTSD